MAKKSKKHKKYTKAHITQISLTTIFDILISPTILIKSSIKPHKHISKYFIC